MKAFLYASFRSPGGALRIYAETLCRVRDAVEAFSV